MSIRSPLYELEAALGAQFKDWFGWEIAVSYGDPLTEYHSLRRDVGILDHSFLGKLRVSGKDRVRYLNNMLSNNIQTLKAGAGCHAALLTRQGLMESDLWVYGMPDQLWLECPACATVRVLETLRKHIISDRVDLDDITQQYGVLSMQGPKAADLIACAFGVAVTSMQPLDHRFVERDGGTWLVAERDRTGSGGFDLWLPVAHLPQAYRRCLEAGAGQPIGQSALDWARTEAGIPWYGIDMDEKTLPLEMGLDAAISTNKGCYRGQEIIARITHRGHLDRRLAGVAIEHELPPASGSAVRAQGQKVGEVTSATFSPALGKPLALAVLKTAFLSPGTQLEIDSDQDPLRGAVVALPVTTGGW